MGWKRALLIVGIVVVLLAGSAAFWLLRPARSQELPEDVSIEQRERNAALYAALVSAGIEDPLVDVSDERAYVAYELPAHARGNASRAETFQRFVLGAAGSAAEGAEQLVAVQHVDGEPRRMWTADAAAYAAMMRGETTPEAFEAGIEKKDP